MIVVVGSPVCAADAAGSGRGAAGLAAETAIAAARAGASVQLVGKVGDDPGGDGVLLALHTAGVGHAAVLRDAVHPTPVPTVAAGTGDDDEAMNPMADPDGTPLPAGLSLEAADVELALRYLTDFSVLVLADPLDGPIRSVAFDAAAFAGAHVVDLHAAGGAGDAGPVNEAGGAAVDDHLTAFDSTDADPEAFGGMAGRYAAGLDAGRTPSAAFADATKAAPWEPAAD